MKKVVVAMDSFKGCLSSTEAEKAAEEGVKQVCPDCEVICFPIAGCSMFWWKQPKVHIKR